MSASEDVSDVSPQRPRSSSIIPDEDFNIQSQERKNLLSELKIALQKDTVKASLWSCLQVSDLSKLRELVAAAATIPTAFFSLLEDNSLSIPLRWMQRRPRDHASSTPSAASSTSSNAPFQTHRPEKPTKLAEERDQHKCALTKASLYEVAHIFPHSMINPKKPTNLEACIPDFWDLLDFFFDSDRLSRWRAELFTDPSNPTKASDGCHNMICMNLQAHGLWARGLFALQPISTSDDFKELTVKFFWQPKSSHGPFDSVDLLESPLSSRDLTQVMGNGLSIHNEDSAIAIPIKSGDRLVFKTSDPHTHPLPSFEILDMQWHLNRIVSMAGAAEIYDVDDSDDDDDRSHSSDY